MGADIASVIDRFEQTLNGVNQPVSSYDGRSSVGNRGSSSGSGSGFSHVDDSAHTQQFSSTLSALLRVLDRLQNVETSTADRTSSVENNSQLDLDISTNSVTLPKTSLEAYLLNNALTDPVNESRPVSIDAQSVMSTVEPIIANVTLSLIDSVAQELQKVQLNEFNVSAINDDQNVTLKILNTNDTDLSLSTTELPLNDDLSIDLTVNDTESLDFRNANETLNNITVVEPAVDYDAEGEEEPEDELQDNIEERYAAFVPSEELLRQVTNPPIVQPENNEDEEGVDEPELIAEAIVGKNVTNIEVTTISADEYLSTKPFLENLVNSSTISEIDLSTVASIALSQSSVANSTSLSEDNPSFIANRQLKRCVYNQVVYVSGQNIDQDDPCRFCVCIDGEVVCYWKNCPPAPEGCADLSFDGVCPRSLYLCPIPVKGQPLPFSDNALKKLPKSDLPSTSNATNLQCDILGVKYGIGELVGVASDPCMECRCALDSLYCSPKCCFQPSVDEKLSDSLTDPSKASRADDPIWLPVLANPLMHLKSEFESQL
ncbi:hypothetical protein CHUAL_007708 [Chamberlinius hualienensis]